MGLPKGRESQGNGVLIVVRGGESPLHGRGTGRQHLKRDRVRDAQILNRVNVVNWKAG